MLQLSLSEFTTNILLALRSIASMRPILIGICLALVFLSISPVSAASSVSGIISSKTTWSATDSPFQVTGHVTVASGVTLTIEPGVTVKFDSGKTLIIDGTLVAQGTSSDGITFTSSAVSPAAGDWGYIKFNSSSTGTTFDGNGDYVSGSILEHCIVEYAGSYAGSGGFDYYVLGAPYINSCTFTNNNGEVGAWRSTGSGYDSVKITDSNFTQNDGTAIRARNATITGNTITYNTEGVSFRGYSGSVITNIVTDNVITHNTGNGIFGSFDEGEVTTISGNQIRDNGGVGVQIHSDNTPWTATTGTISGNTIVRNNLGGIRVGTGSGLPWLSLSLLNPLTLSSGVDAWLRTFFTLYSCNTCKVDAVFRRLKHLLCGFMMGFIYKTNPCKVLSARAQPRMISTQFSLLATV